jgi:hypothetical protein
MKSGMQAIAGRRFATPLFRGLEHVADAAVAKSFAELACKRRARACDEDRDVAVSL